MAAAMSSAATLIAAAGVEWAASPPAGESVGGRRGTRVAQHSHAVRLVGTPVGQKKGVGVVGTTAMLLRRRRASVSSSSPRLVVVPTTAAAASASAAVDTTEDAAGAAAAAQQSVWQNVEEAPEDPILGVTVAYNKDTHAVKLNLGVGAYRTEEGKPFVLESVRKAEARLVSDRSGNKEYLPITGLAAFNKLSRDLILGSDCPAVGENRVATIQCLSGTGSLRVGAEFLAAHYPGNRVVVFMPDPTWGNHKAIFPSTGLSTDKYRYYDGRTRGLDFNGMIADLQAAPSGSVVLLHACAHNPTGVDPLPEQWEGIRQVIREKGHLPFFDSAYQGFASGDLVKDAAAVRSFAEDGGEVLIAQSFAKNMGLYGERVGALSLVCKSEDIAKKVESRVKLIVRRMYSSPPIHGASIAATVLGDPLLREEWMVELGGMANRIIKMRRLLFDALAARQTPGDWTHILKQIGMFTYTGLNKAQVEGMTRDFHVYMTLDGRISMAGLSSSTVDHLADAIHAVVTTTMSMN